MFAISGIIYYYSRTGDRHILTASFQSPGSERLFDEYEFEFQMLRDQILKSNRGS